MKTLRPYQDAAKAGILEAFKTSNSTILVLPTGGGKTTIFVAVIQEFLPKRCLILAHRGELIRQAVAQLTEAGVDCQVEMADERADEGMFTKAPVIVSTVQTQCSGFEGRGRMARFDPMQFGLVVVDECHHGTASGYVKVLEHYRKNPNIKILGVTATPDRADEEALGKVFESVAFDYELSDAIRDGWLVPIHEQLVTVEGLDFSAMRTTAGDLNSGDLAEVMEAEKTLQGVASASIEIIRDRTAIAFAVSVKQAEALSNIFNRHRPGMSTWVCGKTPEEERRKILGDFRAGKTQVVVNVGVLTEGFDAPATGCVILARPTKSRCLFSQMVGRATRPLPGIVDPWKTAAERQDAIKCSDKPACLVVDFTGNCGKHRLVTAQDILGGNYSNDEMVLAKRRAQERGGETDVAEDLEAARKEIEEKKQAEIARRAKLIAKAKFSVTHLDPFSILDLQPARERGWDHGKVISEKMRAILLKQGIDPSPLTYSQSRQLLGEIFRRWDGKLATLKQVKLLKKHGYDTRELTMKAASALIDSLANNGWNRARADAAREAAANPRPAEDATRMVTA